MTDTNSVTSVNDNENVENKSTDETVDIVKEDKLDSCSVETLTAIVAEHIERESKENSSEPQFTDAEKVTDEQINDDGNDSEYEDVDDEEDEIEEETRQTKKDDDDEHIDIKPRRLPKNQQFDENTEDDETENPNTTDESTKRTDRKSEKTNEKIDDDNDARNPAYVPRKGKFYEHDDRTNDDCEQPKPESNKSRNRTFKDFDGKWQHDLFMDYEDDDNTYSTGNRGQGSRRRGGGGGIGRGRRGRAGGNYNRDQLQIDDYIPATQRTHGGSGGYRQQDVDQRRRPHPNDWQRNERTNNFDVEDYNRSTSTNQPPRANRKNLPEQTIPPRQQRREFEQYQTDETYRRNQQSTTPNDQTYHRERNFTNTQYQRTNDGKGHATVTNKRNDIQPINEFQFDDNRNKNQLQKRDNKEPPRRQGNNNNNNNRNPQRQNDNQTTGLSAEAPSFERTKRYSNMRNNNNFNLGQQQQPPPPTQQQQQQQPQIPLQSYQDQPNNYFEQSTWQRASPHAPPPAQNAFIPQQQQMMPQQMFHPQQQIHPSTYYVHSHYQQQAPPPPPPPPHHSQYVPLNYGQGSVHSNTH